jgi:hypothetical protein
MYIYIFGGGGSGPEVWTSGTAVLGRPSIAQATPQPFLLLLIWELGLGFYPGQPELWSYFILPPVPGMTGVHHHTPSVEMESPELFCLGWPGTMILLNSVSKLARITEKKHWHLAEKIFDGLQFMVFLLSLSIMLKSSWV